MPVNHGIARARAFGYPVVGGGWHRGLPAAYVGMGGGVRALLGTYLVLSLPVQGLF